MPSRTGTSAGDTRRTPDAVALAAVQAWLSWDTTVDRRPNDTARRLALIWVTPQLRRQVLRVAGESAPGAEWQEWTRRHARATVTVTLGADDHPPDSPTTAYRQVVATITLRGDAGWTRTVQRTVFLELAPAGDRWLVDKITTSRTS